MRSELPIHVEVWIAARLLSNIKDSFTKQELMELIKTEFNDLRPGISIHISSVCVGNKPTNHPVNYNYLFSISRGIYRIFKENDSPHVDRVGLYFQPRPEVIPEQYRYLIKGIPFDIDRICPDTKKTLYDSTSKRQLDQRSRRKIDIEMLQHKEQGAIDWTILMMAYNPSCARIFSNATNKRNKYIIHSVIERLKEIKDQEGFNSLHREIMDRIANNIENQNSKGVSRQITYGQAQKGLNVFLKVYVDWANLPNSDVADILRPFLHCPLDSVVMKYIKGEERTLYQNHGKPPCSMRAITEYDQYMNWQKICSELIAGCSFPKRTLVDVIWHLESQETKMENL